jgi:hypothetical protein
MRISDVRWPLNAAQDRTSPEISDALDRANGEQESSTHYAFEMSRRHTYVHKVLLGEVRQQSNREQSHAVEEKSSPTIHSHPKYPNCWQLSG